MFIYLRVSEHWSCLLLTNDMPNPARAQLTWVRDLLNDSATGETTLLAGNNPDWQAGHVYPAGAVFAGSWRAYLSIHFQWNTSARNIVTIKCNASGKHITDELQLYCINQMQGVKHSYFFLFSYFWGKLPFFKENSYYFGVFIIFSFTLLSTIFCFKK